MRDILEGAITALLNGDEERSLALFHKYVVGQARQIHESYRQGDAFELEENWDEEIKTESYFTEEDLDNLEGDEADVDADEAGLAGDVADLDADAGADVAEVGADEAGAELDGDLSGEPELGAEPEEDLTADERLDDLEAQVQKMVDEFEELMAAYSDDEGDLDAVGGEDDFAAGSEEGEPADLSDEGSLDDGDVDSDASFDVDAPEDDMEDEAPMEDVEDFAEINESIIDELEKITVTLDGRKELDGTALPAGETGSPVLAQKPNLDGASPIVTKSSKHNGFARETAPPVADMKKRRNTKTKATDGQETVSKEGDASAELNKLKSEKGDELF